MKNWNGIPVAICKIAAFVPKGAKPGDVVKMNESFVIGSIEDNGQLVGNDQAVLAYAREDLNAQIKFPEQEEDK